MAPRRAFPPFLAARPSRSCEEPVVSGASGPFYEIPLTNGGVALVDISDVSIVKPYKWRSINLGFRATYAETNIRGKSLRMHILLVGKRPGLFVDHKNRNGLDNRRDNLRWATRSQNQMNIDKPRGRKGTSKFKGVDWIPSSKKWRAKIRHNKKGYTLGRFVVEEDAARAYDAAAMRLFGEFARINFEVNQGGIKS